MHKSLLIGASIIAVVAAPAAAIAQEVSATPTAASAQDVAKSYPICTSRGQDSCQNPGEGGAPSGTGSSSRGHDRFHHAGMHHHHRMQHKI